MVSQPIPVNRVDTELLLIHLQFDPRFDELDVEIVRRIAAGTYNSEQLAGEKDITRRALEYRVKGLRDAGIIVGDARRRHLSPHPDPMPIYLPAWQDWAARMESEKTGGRGIPKWVGFFGIGFHRLSQAMLKALTQLNQRRQASADEFPFPAYKEAITPAPVESPSLVKHHGALREHDAQTFEQEVRAKGFQPCTAGEAAAWIRDPRRPILNPVVRPWSRGMARAFDLPTYRLLEQTVFDLSLCDRVARAQYLELRRMGIEHEKALTWLLSFTGATLGMRFIGESAGKREPARYAAALADCLDPEVDHFTMLSLIAKSGMVWGVNHGSLVVAEPAAPAAVPGSAVGG